MKSVRWLKVKEQITFTLCVLMFQIKNGLAPSFVADLMVTPQRRQLRSVSQHDFDIPGCSLVRTMQSSLTYAGPSAWNNLPLFLKRIIKLDVFKSELNTWLFCNCYSLTDSHLELLETKGTLRATA